MRIFCLGLVDQKQFLYIVVTSTNFLKTLCSGTGFHNSRLHIYPGKPPGKNTLIQAIQHTQF